MSYRVKAKQRKVDFLHFHWRPEEFFQFTRKSACWKGFFALVFSPAWGFSGSPLFADIAALLVVCDRTRSGRTKSRDFSWRKSRKFSVENRENFLVFEPETWKLLNCDRSGNFKFWTRWKFTRFCEWFVGWVAPKKTGNCNKVCDVAS